MRASGLLATGLCLLSAQATAQAPSQEAFQPVGTVKQLMLEIVYPASNEILLAVSRGGPGSEREWAAVRRSAMTLAESGNLLIIRNRSDAWIKASRSLIDVGAAAYKAAEAKNGTALAALDERLDVACTECHKQFRQAVFAPAK